MTWSRSVLSQGRDRATERWSSEQVFGRGRRDSNPLAQPREVEALLDVRHPWVGELDWSGLVPGTLQISTNYPVADICEVRRRVVWCPPVSSWFRECVTRL